MLTLSELEEHLATVGEHIKSDLDETEHKVVDSTMAIIGSFLKAVHVIASPPANAGGDSSLVP